MTLWHENLQRVLALVIELRNAAALEVDPFDKDDYDKWLARSRAVDQRLRDRLDKDADARFTENGDVTMVRLAGIRATSTCGLHGALGNWTAMARKRLAEVADPINLQGSGPAPVVPRVPGTTDVMKAALQWLLDDMYTAGETHDASSGDIFDSVEDAAAALIEAGGNLSWYSIEDAETYRAGSEAESKPSAPTADALQIKKLRQRIGRLTDPDHRVVAAELRAIAAEKPEA